MLIDPGTQTHRLVNEATVGACGPFSRGRKKPHYARNMMGKRAVWLKDQRAVECYMFSQISPHMFTHRHLFVTFTEQERWQECVWSLALVIGRSVPKYKLLLFSLLITFCPWAKAQVWFGSYRPQLSECHTLFPSVWTAVQALFWISQSF